MNVRLAEEFAEGEEGLAGTPEELENLRWQRTLWKSAHKYEATYHRDVKHKGLSKLNADRMDAAADTTDQIRGYAKPGMSAEQVRQRTERNGEEPPSVRTIQRHLKKIYPDRN